MTDAVGAVAHERDRKLPFGTKLAYGFGAAAYGIKDNGFAYFLMLFYGTVVGLEPGLVGLAILIALCVDAISDPLVGYWSDNFRSKWGRRHPFMYTAALPIALVYFLLWNPPDWSDGALFAYLLGMAVLIRTLITFYEIPSAALMPELTANYEDRTSIQAFRFFFGWVVGNLLTLIMWGVLLVATAEYPQGALNRDGYATYGIIASVLIFVAIMVSSLGTHSNIKHLRPPPERKVRTPREIFGEIAQTLRTRSFGALFLTTIFGQTASGFQASLAFLMLSFFWEFSQQQIFIGVSLVFVSAVIGLLLAPRAVKHLGKKKAVISIGIVAFTLAPLMVALRLLGVLPENGDPLLFPIIIAVNTIDVGLVIAFQAIVVSMIADLVEESELRTGRRSEGVFFASITFTRKASQGIGAALTGIALSLIAFPQGEAAISASPATLWALGAIYVTVLWVLWSAMLYSISRYKIDKAQHQENLRRLAEAG